MAGPIHLSELKAGQCRQSVEARLLRFWESWNVKKGGELMGFDMLLVDLIILTASLMQPSINALTPSKTSIQTKLRA